MLIGDTMHSSTYQSNIGASHVFTIPGALYDQMVLGYVSGPCDGRKGGREGGWESHHYLNILVACTHLILSLDAQKVRSIDTFLWLAVGKVGLQKHVPQ